MAYNTIINAPCDCKSRLNFRGAHLPWQRHTWRPLTFCTINCSGDRSILEYAGYRARSRFGKADGSLKLLIKEPWIRSFSAVDGGHERQYKSVQNTLPFCMQLIMFEGSKQTVIHYLNAWALFKNNNIILLSDILLLRRVNSIFYCVSNANFNFLNTPSTCYR